MALDHVSVGVGDMVKSKLLYDAILNAVGLKPVYPVEIAGQGLVAVGYGETPQKAEFWIQLPINGREATYGNGAHIAFRASCRAAVDAFYAAAMQYGASDEGAPGLRTEYHPDYYAAFIRDLDGNKLEACCHAHA